MHKVQLRGAIVAGRQVGGGHRVDVPWTAKRPEIETKTKTKIETKTKTETSMTKLPHYFSTTISGRYFDDKFVKLSVIIT